MKEKLIKLTDFINSKKFYELCINNRLSLNNQKIVMELYLNVLNMRVFEDVDKIVVPDYGMMQVMGSVFGLGNMNTAKAYDVAIIGEAATLEQAKLITQRIDELHDAFNV